MGTLLAIVLAAVAISLSHRGGDSGAGHTVAGRTDASGSPAVPSAGAAPSPGGSTASPAIGQPTSIRSPAAPTSHRAAAGGSGGSGSGDATGAIKTGGFPNAGNTGPRITLKPHNTGALSINTNGTVISGWDITGSLDIYANNVTIIDSRVTSNNWWGINLRPGFSGLRILHTTITGLPGKGPDNGGEDYAVSNMGGSSVEVGWTNISEFGNMLSMGQGNLHDNYLHDVSEFINQSGGWQHADAIISDGGNSGSLIIRHNTLLNQVGVDHGASGSVGLFADTGNVANAVVDGNWIAGGSYALYGGGAGATGIKVTNNIFSTQFHPNCGEYGAVAAWNAGGAGNVWSNNKMSDGRVVTPS
ncbi:hypothetical protein [Streptacidiphilus sp. PAMC 29251]